MPPQGLLVIAAAVPELAGPFRRREHGARRRARISPGPRWCSSAACTCSGRRSRTSGAARMRSTGSRCWAAPRSRPARSIIPDFDYLHVGEMGDATDELFARLDDDADARRRQQVVLDHRRAPRARRIPDAGLRTGAINRYFLGSIQFSSGCPYQCEFCDIPALYGRDARYKTAEQVCAELDKLVAAGCRRGVFRRRQFHRQPARRARAAAAPDRVAEAQRLSAASSPARRRSTSPSDRRSSS